MPNDATADLEMALAIAGILGDSPTPQAINSYKSMTPQEALEDIITQAFSTVPRGLAGAVFLDSDWYYSPWFGMFAYTSNSTTNWVYSWRFGWTYISPTSTPSATWLYSIKLNAWLWSSTEMNGFYYEAGRNTWIYLLPAGSDAAGAWLNYMDTSQWQFIKP